MASVIDAEPPLPNGKPERQESFPLVSADRELNDEVYDETRTSVARKQQRTSLQRISWKNFLIFVATCVLPLTAALSVTKESNKEHNRLTSRNMTVSPLVEVSSTEYKSAVDVAKDLADGFKELAGPATDMIEKLKLITERTCAVLHSAGPFGLLLATSLDIVRNERSKEYQALEKLSQSMNYQFARLNERIDFVFKVPHFKNEISTFKTMVRTYLGNMDDEILHFSDPSKPKGPSAIRQMMAKCEQGSSHYSGAMVMAHYIRDKTSVGCSLNGTELYVKVNGLFNGMMDKFELTHWRPEEMELQNRIVSILFSMNIDDSLAELEKIEARLASSSPYDEYSTASSALESIHILLKPKLLNDKEPRTCLTDAAVYASRFDRRLLIVGDFCAGFMYPDISEMEEWLQRFASNLTATSGFLVDYLPKKLNTSATYEKFVANEAISLYPGTDDIPPESYSKMADLIVGSIRQMRISTVKKQILIMPSNQSDDKYSAHFICPEYWCTLETTNDRGVNYMITRFKKSDVVYARSLQVRVSLMEAPIRKFLKGTYWIDLDHLVADMAKQNISLVSPFSRSAAIIRHTLSWFTLEWCSFPSAVSEYHTITNASRPVANFQYNNSRDFSGFDRKRCNDFYFFL